jgi:hypothetical protein
MRQAGLNAALWSAFALLILVGGYVMLRACDLGFKPLFGSASCAAPTLEAELATEREKRVLLQSRIHAEEIRFALLPACPISLPPKPPAPPQPVPPEPKPDPKPDPQIVQKFEIPKHVEDLKGCWQSARGDLDIYDGDKLFGKARFCYCFGNNGRGKVLIRYTDGDVCQTDLTARLSTDQVFMHHGTVSCRKNGTYAGSDITCRNDRPDRTICHEKSVQAGERTEEFVRVSDEHCGWNGGSR